MGGLPGGSRFDFGPMAPDYEAWYETPRGRGFDRIQKRDVRALLPRPRPGARLLEIGCGTGHWSRFFAAAGYCVTAVDVSPEMITAAREHGDTRCRFEVADACNLPFPDGAFDVSAAVATLEFVRDRHAAVAEMLRCTRAGGTVIIGALNRLAPINRRRLAEGKQPYASGKLQTPRKLRELLAEFSGGRPIRMIPMETPGLRELRRPSHKALIVAAVTNA